MTPFTQAQTEQLLANCQAQIVGMDNAEDNIDFTPVAQSILRLAGPFVPAHQRGLPLA
jgi:hypothetical protein